MHKSEKNKGSTEDMSQFCVQVLSQVSIQIQEPNFSSSRTKFRNFFELFPNFPFFGIISSSHQVQTDSQWSGLLLEKNFLRRKVNLLLCIEILETVSRSEQTFFKVSNLMQKIFDETFICPTFSLLFSNPTYSKVTTSNQL